MLRSRIIPSLLVADGRLVKTQVFGAPKYVGDPINAVRIFNEKEVDELCVFDITASRTGRAPDLRLIEDIASQCRMPLCYGGGVRTPEAAKTIIDLGVEKVAVSTAALQRPELVAEMATEVGSQSVVVVLDAKQHGPSDYRVVSHGPMALPSSEITEVARYFSENGAGEIVINSVDRDGMQNGYDLDLAGAVHDAIDVPMTVLGGAGSVDDIRMLVERFGIIGAAAGSLFVFRGRLRAVLISYPRREDLAFARGAAN